MITVTCVLYYSCDFSQTTDPKVILYPAHFPEVIKAPSRNVTSKAGILLGKRLFFDPNLSGNKEVACSTCHKPELAFTDGKKVSNAGVNHTLLKRNTPTLINTAWMNGLFWDGGAKNLESLPFAALTNPDEMGTDLGKLAQDLNRDLEYKKLFQSAFSIDSITSAHIARALAQYQRSLISADSKFDMYINSKSSLSNTELAGYKIFSEKCAVCHTPPLFTDNGYHNNGLDSIFPSSDLRIMMGRFRITRDSSDIGSYKTPTLRNLALTAPYMHDGRFETLEQVLDHYQSGLVHATYTDSLMQYISLTDLEKQHLVFFLSTLQSTSWPADN